MTDDIHDDVCDLQDSDLICIVDSIVFAVGKPSNPRQNELIALATGWDRASHVARNHLWLLLPRMGKRIYSSTETS